MIPKGDARGGGWRAGRLGGKSVGVGVSWDGGKFSFFTLRERSPLQQLQQSIEQTPEEMIFTSDSEMESPADLSPPNPLAPHSENKRKKIRKDRRKRSRRELPTRQRQIRDVEDLVAVQGERYFGLRKAEALESVGRKVRVAVHVRRILGLQSNVFQITNYEKSTQIARAHLALNSLLNNYHFRRVAVTQGSSRVVLDVAMPPKGLVNRPPPRLLSRSEILLTRGRSAVLQQVQSFFAGMGSEKQRVGWMQKEILSLCRLNTLQEKELLLDINCKMEEDDPLQNLHLEDNQSSQTLVEEYEAMLLVKHMGIGLKEERIDFLNYFKRAEHQEKEESEEMTQLETIQQLQEFLKSRRFRPSRLQEQWLRTCCGACFSDCSQLANPLDTCPDCGTRTHRLCQSIKGKCQRCRYVRKPQEEKNHTPYCSICLRCNEKGLTLSTLNENAKEEYAHTFCLLAQGHWRIQDHCVKGSLLGRSSLATCKECTKTSHFTLPIPNSSQRVHALCGYLAGYSMRTEGKAAAIVSTCPSAQLSLQRKFRLNFQKLLSRQGEEFQLLANYL